jgi:hypothetical protein
MATAPFGSLRDETVKSRRAAWGSPQPLIANKIQEKWMKSAKTSVIACTLSALLAGPVLAQGVSSDSKARGSVQSKGVQGGASASEDEELNAQPGAAGEKVGMKSTKGTKGTVGTTGSAAHKGAVDDSTSGGAAAGKRY